MHLIILEIHKLFLLFNTNNEAVTFESFSHLVILGFIKHGLWICLPIQNELITILFCSLSIGVIQCLKAYSSIVAIFWFWIICIEFFKMVDLNELNKGVNCPWFEFFHWLVSKFYVLDWYDRCCVLKSWFHFVFDKQEASQCLCKLCRKFHRKFRLLILSVFERWLTHDQW